MIQGVMRNLLILRVNQDMSRFFHVFKLVVEVGVGIDDYIRVPSSDLFQLITVNLNVGAMLVDVN